MILTFIEEFIIIYVFDKLFLMFFFGNVRSKKKTKQEQGVYKILLTSTMGCLERIVRPEHPRGRIKLVHPEFIPEINSIIRLPTNYLKCRYIL